MPVKIVLVLVIVIVIGPLTVFPEALLYPITMTMTSTSTSTKILLCLNKWAASGIVTLLPQPRSQP